jgi:putative chitinase
MLRGFKRFNLATATSVAREPEQIANIVNASRLGNGPAVTGDGWWYRGRGLIQVTGWVNYQACSSALSLDLLKKPELLEQPVYAAASAAWFWSSNGLMLASSKQSLDVSMVVSMGSQSG